MFAVGETSTSRKLRYLRREAPKWGDEAAEYGWKFEQLKLYATPLIFGLAAVGFIMNIIPLLIFNVAVGFSVAIAALWIGRQMFRASSRDLGVKVSWNHGPHRRGEQGYTEWCAEVGLTPYAAPNQFSRSTE
jgi:hypothetical protein